MRCFGWSLVLVVLCTDCSPKESAPSDVKTGMTLAQLAKLVRVVASPADARVGGIWTERPHDTHVPARSLLGQPVRTPFDAEVSILARCVPCMHVMCALLFVCSPRTGSRRSIS